MWACKFSDKESSNAGKQMAVRRAREKAAGGKRKALPPNLIDVPTDGLTVSPMTAAVSGGTSPNSPPSTPTMLGSMRSTRPTSKPKMKCIRRSSQAMQKVQMNKLAMSDHSKRTLKRAMKWYAREQKITCGLSSYQIEKKGKREFGGVGPCAMTICHYVNSNLQGMSPLKIGVKGDVPPCAFKASCASCRSTPSRERLLIRSLQYGSMQFFITIMGSLALQRIPDEQL